MARTPGAFCKARQHGEARAKAWQAMRVMRRFTVTDLVTTSGIGEDNCSKYVRRLARAKFLRLSKARACGVPGSCHVWLLVRDSGPRAPILRTDGTVYDPNTRTVHIEEAKQ